MNPRDSIGAVTFRYAAFGLALGLSFPAGALAYLVASGAVPAAHGIPEIVVTAHRTEPLMLVIWAAPVVLSLLAAFAGVREARIRRFSERLEFQVAQTTESLRTALTEARHANATIAHMADHDPLTGLYNRRRLREELDRILAAAQRYHRGAGVLFIDLDDLKSVNDRLGHEAGDETLRTAAAILREIVRSTDFACRWGGDEFALLLSETTREGACVLAERLVAGMRQRKVRIGETERTLSWSVGVALFPESARTADELIARADAAMYRAKRAGGGGWLMHREDQAEVGRLDENRRWTARVRQALESDRFVVVYQPVARLTDGTFREYEALLRLENARGELVESALFIEAADESGLGLPLDRLVIERALRRLPAAEASKDAPRISVNLFPSTLLQPDLVAMLEETAAATGGDLSRLGVEIPDWAAAQNLTPLGPVASELRRLGCRIIVDDLGAGFLSLVHLRRLGVATVKLHRTLVEKAATDPEASALLRSFAKSLRELGIEVVAKHIEHPAQLAVVLDHGIELVQGYAVGRPAESLAGALSLPGLAAGA